MSAVSVIVPSRCHLRKEDAASFGGLLSTGGQVVLLLRPAAQRCGPSAWEREVEWASCLWRVQGGTWGAVAASGELAFVTESRKGQRKAKLGPSVSLSPCLPGKPSPASCFPPSLFPAAKMAAAAFLGRDVALTLKDRVW